MRILTTLSLALLCTISVNANPFAALMGSRDKAEEVRAISNGKNIFVALISFAMDHEGLYPCADTGPAATAEDCFNQLIKGGYIDESVFWIPRSAKHKIASAEKPNNDGVLTASENSWGYVAGLSSSSSTRLPIIFDSSIKSGEFLSSMWKGRAIVAKIDGSVRLMAITPDATEKSDSASIKATPKSGIITEKRGSRTINIFAELHLPRGTTILPPQLAKK